MIGLVPLVLVQLMGMFTLVVVCLLDVLYLVTNTSLGEVAALSLEGLQTMFSPLWCSYSSSEM
jgi:hypothetical protein